jgi:hypothetical protein
MNFNPWHLHPWEIRAERDGIPQNRQSDGLYDSNLQPPSELDTVRYDFLAGSPTGKILLMTRELPVDSPVTEFQIREGFYGYGTVDFAHGQRVYHSLSLQLSGRLVWYDGMRDSSSSSSRFNRVRGKLGFSLGDRFQADVTYAGSSVNSGFPNIDSGPISKREEGILAFAEKDSMRTEFRPSLTLYMRQDREDWGPPFRLWESTQGWRFEAHATLLDQHFSFRQLTSFSRFSFPGVDKTQEWRTEIGAGDSIQTYLGAIILDGTLHQSVSKADRISPLANASARAFSRSYHNFQLLGGIQYLEETPPTFWLRGRYPLADYPLSMDSTFTNLNREFVPSGAASGRNDADRYLKSAIGFRWQREHALLEMQVLSLTPQGKFHNELVGTDTSVHLSYERIENQQSQLGLSSNLVLPLLYGFRIDSWWFTQVQSDRLFHAIETRGYSRLYFERSFFKSQLTIRSHVSYEHIGTRYAFSNLASGVLGPAHLIGFRLSATIRGVTLMWGTENFLRSRYDILPGYKMIGKEEYIGVIWRLWL